MSSYQKPNLDYFKSVKIEGKILDPKFSRGFGVSKLGLRGIEVVSTSPPGREADPLAAAEQASEDERKSVEERRSRSEEESDDNGAGGNNSPREQGRGRGNFPRQGR